MTESNKIEIALSESKLAKLLLVSILFLGGGLWIVLTDPQISNPFFNSPFVKAFASYGAAIMGLLGVYFFSKKLVDRRPGLVIDENGIYDNTSAFNFGLIPWSDISEVYDQAVRASPASKQQFVTIGLFDADKYIEREKSTLKRKLLSINAKSYGSPIHISTNGLKTTHTELLHLLTAEHARYKRQQ